jgi:hypothetical protein
MEPTSVVDEIFGSRFRFAVQRVADVGPADAVVTGSVDYRPQSSFGGGDGCRSTAATGPSMRSADPTLPIGWAS